MKRREKGISFIVGQAFDEKGVRIPLYRAERNMACSSCGAIICAGELFTRRALAGQLLLRLSAQCKACAPFGPDEKKAAEMMKTLLSSEHQSTEAEPSEEAARRTTVAEAVERRLGPALRYSREPKEMKPKRFKR